MGDENFYGDRRNISTDHYVNVSSAQRDKSSFPNSNDCEISFDNLSNVTDMEIVNFEIPHTRYAIDEENNTFYISEQVADGVYNFFGLKASTGGYTIGNLAVTLELSTQSPICYTEDAVLLNTYNLVTSGSFGKVGIISSGDYPYNIHVCQQTLKLVTFEKVSDTEASITFISPYEYILAPGAMLTLNLFNLPDRQIQVTGTGAARTVTVIGDFATIDDAEINTSLSEMVPFSSINCCTNLAGFGEVDLSAARNNASFKVLAMQSPFSTAIEDGTTTPMILTDFPVYLSAEDHCVITGTDGFVNAVPLQVVTTHDDTHFEVSVDVSTIYSASGSVSVITDSGSFEVVSIDIVSSSANVITLTIESSAVVSVGETVTFSGFDAKEWEDIEATVISVDTTTFNVEFTYPTSYSFVEGETYITPINSVTGCETTYISPGRFDLSRGRRVLLCKAIVENLEIGTIQIPGSRDKFFGRIQLFAGGDLVNFTNLQQAVGKHRFNSVLKRLNKIRLQFYNEDGSEYNFVGVDYSMFIRVRCLSSNTGL